MTRIILGLGALALVAWAGRTFWPSRSAERKKAAAAAGSLRDAVLSRELLAGLPTGALGAIRGVVMDWNLGDGLATLVAIDDGSVSLYLNPGGGIIGAGSHPNVADAAAEFRRAAVSRRESFRAGKTFPVPGPDSVVFYLLTDSATLTTGPIAVADVQQPTHPLTALGTSSQTLLHEVRRSSEAHQ